MKWDLALVALAVLMVAAGSRRLEGTSVTPAMAFMFIGLLIGPLVVNGVDVSSASHELRTLAEATLAVVLFSDASRIRTSALRREFGVPARLLGIGLPLTIALGALLASALFGSLSLGEVLVLSVVLAPTDAALGQAVVSDPRLPSRIRQGLNVESGLNDGICVPLLLIFLAAADVESKTESSHHAVRIVAEQIGGGLLGGAVAGAISAVIIVVFRRRDLIAGAWLQVIPVATAALAYGLALGLGGSGFIAAFVAGALFGGVVSGEAEQASRLSEELGDLLGGVTFLMFGAVLLGPTLKHLDLAIVSYAVLSLTAVRMLPVAIAMLGTGARLPTVGFLGWFGPRGLASIVFAVIVIEEAKLPGTGTILLVVYTTIGLSVVAHGLSAVPLADRYARWFESHPSERRPVMESVPATLTRPRGIRVQPSSPQQTGSSRVEEEDGMTISNGPA